MSHDCSCCDALRQILNGGEAVISLALKVREADSEEDRNFLLAQLLDEAKSLKTIAEEVLEGEAVEAL